MGSNFGIYSGAELFDYKEEVTLPIIDKILYDRDQCLLVGREKVGKSLLAMQMGLCIASGDDFLDIYEVPTPLPVLYVQTEGKVAETAERVKRMSKTITPRPENFGFCFEPSLALDSEEGYAHLLDAVDKAISRGTIRSPKVIFLDPVYSAMSGDFNDNEDAKLFVNNLKRLGDRFASAIVMIHHQHKTKRDDKGREVHEYGGDSATGSAVFSYHVDVGYTFTRTTDKVRHLDPYATRTGKITPKLDLLLVDRGEPLFFTIAGDATASYEIVKWYFDKDITDGTIKDIMTRANISRDSVNKALRHWVEKGYLERIPGCSYPIRFRRKP